MSFYLWYLHSLLWRGIMTVRCLIWWLDILTGWTRLTGRLISNRLRLCVGGFLLHHLPRTVIHGGRLILSAF